MSMNSSISNMSKFTGSTSEFIAQTLRIAIFKGKYKANQPLRQDRIAKELNVSKIPLREALVQLKSEGLVVFLPNRGAVVSMLSPAEVREIFSMRLALESLAVEKAVPNIREAELIRARSVLKIIDREKDKSTWSDLNREFHEILYKPSNMRLLLNTIQTLHNNVGRYLVIYLDRLSGTEASREEHWGILDAYKEKNIDKAQSILKTHLGKAEEHLMRFLGEFSEVD